MRLRCVRGASCSGWACSALYAWSGHFWIDPIDEGYFLDMADRV